jgi:hypothetical protein
VNLWPLWGGTIIDGHGGAPIKDGALVIEGKRITAVGRSSTPVPAEATRTDATRKFLIPGLKNSSAYLCSDPPLLAALKFEGRYDELAIEAAHLARRMA